MNLFHHFRKLSVTDSFKNVIRHFPVFVKNGKNFSEKGLFFVYFGRLLKKRKFCDTIQQCLLYEDFFSFYVFLSRTISIFLMQYVKYASQFCKKISYLYEQLPPEETAVFSDSP